MEEVKPSANSRIRISSRRDVSFILKFQCDNGSSHHHPSSENKKSYKSSSKKNLKTKKSYKEGVLSQSDPASLGFLAQARTVPRASRSIREMLSRPSCPISSIFGFSKTSIWKYLLCDVMNLSASPYRTLMTFFSTCRTQKSCALPCPYLLRLDRFVRTSELN